MRVLSFSAAVIVLLGAVGCARIQYSFEPFRAAGTSVPVEVTVPHKADERIAGTVYYRTNGFGSYRPLPMEARGDRLWALLPTDDLGPKETCEYYVDVQRGDELHAISSPVSPFVVTFLGKVDMLLASIRDSVSAGYDHEPVRFTLSAGRHVIDPPRVVYQMPAVPGDVRADMTGDTIRGYQLVVPPHAVHAGTWRYAIEVTYEGATYRIPQQGYRSFEVRLRPPPTPVVVKPHHAEEETKSASAGE